ncbi:MAG: UDP-3-O-acyl-N-acetylglucosamine deacetylase, partial [Kiritimatiellaeota bacterium]|nr:UDP-3-O-acyl-N-acetylglucosamine deacetylase [Kiritimatiellota bacterium]
ALTRYASEARTNSPLWKMVYCKTIGLLFADIRNLGYTPENLQIAGRHRYFNTPRLLHEGKCLEAVWHRAVLDLLAALALIAEGRFCGEVTSFKAGHHLDVQLVCQLYRHGLLQKI